MEIMSFRTIPVPVFITLGPSRRSEERNCHWSDGRECIWWVYWYKAKFNKSQQIRRWGGDKKCTVPYLSGSVIRFLKSFFNESNRPDFNQSWPRVPEMLSRLASVRIFQMASCIASSRMVPEKISHPLLLWASFPPSSSRSCVCGGGGEGGWLFPAFWLAFMRFFRHACMLIWTRIRKRMRVWKDDEICFTSLGALFKRS